MAVDIRGRRIEKVAIIDDAPESRRGYGYTVVNAELTPLPQDGPLGSSVTEYLASPSAMLADAGICDFKLNERPAYATFSGAELVAKWYLKSIPAVLCTRYERSSFPDIAPYRRWIPSLLKPGDLNEDSLIKAIDECVFELQGNFRPSRRPWRTQVHFIGPENEYGDVFFAEIPAAGIDEIIKVRIKDLPAEMQPMLAADFRCYAHVNLGAEDFEDLYWYKWELP